MGERKGKKPEQGASKEVTEEKEQESEVVHSETAGEPQESEVQSRPDPLAVGKVPTESVELVSVILDRQEKEDAGIPNRQVSELMMCQGNQYSIHKDWLDPDTLDNTWPPEDVKEVLSRWWEDAWNHLIDPPLDATINLFMRCIPAQTPASVATPKIRAAACALVIKKSKIPRDNLTEAQIKAIPTGEMVLKVLAEHGDTNTKDVNVLQLLVEHEKSLVGTMERIAEMLVNMTHNFTERASGIALQLEERAHDTQRVMETKFTEVNALIESRTGKTDTTLGGALAKGGATSIRAPSVISPPSRASSVFDDDNSTVMDSEPPVKIA